MNQLLMYFYYFFVWATRSWYKTDEVIMLAPFPSLVGWTFTLSRQLQQQALHVKKKKCSHERKQSRPSTCISALAHVNVKNPYKDFFKITYQITCFFPFYWRKELPCLLVVKRYIIDSFPFVMYLYSIHLLVPLQSNDRVLFLRVL